MAAKVATVNVAVRRNHAVLSGFGRMGPSGVMVGVMGVGVEDDKAVFIVVVKIVVIKLMTN